MFFKGSRYRKLPDRVFVDAGGGRLRSVSLRMTPDVDGAFHHTLAEGDRLDLLAYRYYKAPKKWWRIADAAKTFSCPLNLLGKGPLRQVRIPLNVEDAHPPWQQLMGNLRDLIGVEDFSIEETVRLVETDAEFEGEPMTTASEHFDRAVVIRYNRLNLEEEDLISAVVSAGFQAGEVQEIGRIGKQIVIPPDTAG